MKKLILGLCFAAAGVASVFAQGQINFANSSAVTGDTVDRRVYLDSVGGTRAPVTFVAQLWQLNPATSNFEAVGNPERLRASTTGNPLGTFGPQTVTLLTGWATPATLQVRVWSSPGQVDSWATAETQGRARNISDNFAYTAPSGPSSPPADFVMRNFTAMVVPEPSVIALAVLGLGALLLRRRS